MPVSSAVADPPAGRSPWMDVDWRAHLRWISMPGRPVNVLDVGEGPAVVFLHGLSGCWQNWLASIPPLAGDHRVIAIDLPGFGESPMPADPISISAYARLVVALLDELGVREATIVGNSMGGFVGCAMAIRFPARVQRLVLVAAAGLSLRHGFGGVLEAMTAYPIRDRLGEIRCPALIVWGEEDRLVPVRDAAEFAWLIPDARKILYPDTGHMVMLERPERFNADVRAFIQAA